MTTEIQIIINVLSILLAAYLSYYFTKQRYTYEKLYDRKLIYLEEIYGKIISLEKDLKKYIYTIGADMSKESLLKKQEKILPIQNKFFELQEFFWKKEIILNKSSVLVVQSFIDMSIKTLSKLKTSICSQSINDHKISYEQWNGAFQVMKDEFVKTKDQLKKDFRTRIKN